MDPILAQVSFKSPRSQDFWQNRMHLDLPLLSGLLLVSGIAMVVLYSASGQDFGTLLRQIVRLALALTVMTGIAQIHPRHLHFAGPVLYAAGVLMLIAVLLFGKISMGAQRWLDLEIIRFQPSELMKLSAPMMLLYAMSLFSLKV